MQIISAGSSLIFLQADLSKTSNNRLPILSKMEIFLLNYLADPKSGSPGSFRTLPGRAGRETQHVPRHQLPFLLYVVFIPVPDPGRCTPENRALLIV